MSYSGKASSDTGSSTVKSNGKSEVITIDQTSTNLKGDLRGVFGFGISKNDNLDFLNLVVLAVTGLIIKLCFNEVGGNKRKRCNWISSNYNLGIWINSNIIIYYDIFSFEFKFNR